MLQQLLIMFGLGSVDGALAGLHSSMKNLERVQIAKEQEADVADAQIASLRVKRDEATDEAARAKRIGGKVGALLS